ncbi:MAG: hypothetical protein JWL82_72 [Parcubacteria group bacterium]|nr:hypothetical protein [Parcubacteria group bacterium]
MWYNPLTMETPTTTAGSAKTTPKDFFLWLGAVIALYGSISSFIALKFSYINYLFPDALASYGDPYGGAVRFSMAALVVLVPTTIVLMFLLRKIIINEPAKATLWVRRWALGLTIFIATLTILIDLVTLINTFLGGEISVRFGLKVLVVLVVALFIFFHTLADMKGYWIRHGGRARIMAGVIAAIVALSIIAGFFIIGTPGHVRMLRFDDQKVSDLQNIQYQALNYYQQKGALPTGIDALNDPLSNFIAPSDPQTNAPYTYETTGSLSFKLCANFNADSVDTKGRGSTNSVSYPSPAGGASDNWQHGKGMTCFDRTIDPALYPKLPYPKPL